MIDLSKQSDRHGIHLWILEATRKERNIAKQRYIKCLSTKCYVVSSLGIGESKSSIPNIAAANVLHIKFNLLYKFCTLVVSSLWFLFV